MTKLVYSVLTVVYLMLTMASALEDTATTLPTLHSKLVALAKARTAELDKPTLDTFLKSVQDMNAKFEAQVKEILGLTVFPSNFTEVYEDMVDNGQLNTAKARQVSQLGTDIHTKYNKVVIKTFNVKPEDVEMTKEDFCKVSQACQEDTTTTTSTTTEASVKARNEEDNEVAASVPEPSTGPLVEIPKVGESKSDDAAQAEAEGEPSAATRPTPLLMSFVVLYFTLSALATRFQGRRRFQ